MKRRAGALILAITLIGSGCSGDDDAYPEKDFIEQVTANGVTEAVAQCTYDAIKDDDEITDELKRAGGPNDKISAAVAEKMSRVIATCLLGRELDDNPDNTTTTESDSDTTDPKSDERDTTTTEPERTTTTERERDTTTTTAKQSGDDKTTTTLLGTRSGRDG